MKSNHYNLLSCMPSALKCVIFSLVLTFSTQNLLAQWQAYSPAFSDTLGAFDLRIAQGNDQVAWCVAMKYEVTPTAYNWLPSENLYFAKTTDGGNTWDAGTIPMGVEPYASSLCPISANTAWASGLDVDFVSYVLRTDDGGVSWTRQLEDGYADAASYVDFVHFWDAQNGLAVGDPTTSATDPVPFYEIYTTTDGGQNWVRVPSANIPAPEDDFGSSALYEVQGDYVWFGTIDATTFLGKRLYRSKDRGRHWEVLPNAAESFGFFSFADTLHGLAARRISSAEAQLKYTTDGGDTWTKLPSLIGQELTSGYVLIPKSNYILAVRRSNNISGPFRTILSKDLGQSWQEIGIGEHAATLRFSSPTVGYGGEWQPANHPTRMYKYVGSPLSGLLSGLVLDARFTISPNPSNGPIRVQFEAAQASDFILLLNNAQGQLLGQTVLPDTNTGEAQFDLSAHPAGLYTVTLSSAKGSLTQRVIRH